jgi:SAM-dependent methyltransferase
MTWAGLSDWWIDEVNHDPAYEEIVTPLLLELLKPVSGHHLLDIGCGDGRIMADVAKAGAIPIGIDSEHSLLRRAAPHGSVARVSLPSMAPIASDSVDGAYICLVLEHIDDHDALLSEAARVVRDSGNLVLVINHPIFTAPDSAPIHDSDGETLWRPGQYFEAGWTDEPAGGGSIRFHHRSMAELVNSAANAGWSLEVMREVGLTDQQLLLNPGLAGQEHIPRLLGVRWRRGT